MRRAFLSAMTPTPAPPSPAAVAAFLRGLDKRARLFAAVQAGDAARGERALAAVARVFAAEAAQWPLAQWPQQYWRLLLATPSLRHAAAPEENALLPGVARLAPDVSTRSQKSNRSMPSILMLRLGGMVELMNRMSQR